MLNKSAALIMLAVLVGSMFLVAVEAAESPASQPVGNSTTTTQPGGGGEKGEAGPTSQPAGGCKIHPGDDCDCGHSSWLPSPWGTICGLWRYSILGVAY